MIRRFKSVWGSIQISMLFAGRQHRFRRRRLRQLRRRLGRRGAGAFLGRDVPGRGQAVGAQLAHGAQVRKCWEDIGCWKVHGKCWENAWKMHGILENVGNCLETVGKCWEDVLKMLGKVMAGDRNLAAFLEKLYESCLA